MAVYDKERLFFLGAVVQAPRPMSRRKPEEEEENVEGSFVFNY